MIGFVRSMITKLGVVGEHLRFLWQRELWGLTPKVAVMKRSLIAFITIFGIVAIVLAASCACTPPAIAQPTEASATASAPATATEVLPVVTPIVVSAATEAPPAATLTATFAAITRGGSSSGDYYVSPEGSDSNPGTEAQPFKTIERARQAVRAAIASGMSSDITVLIRGGKYFLSSTLSFNEQDSGRNGYQVVYRNYPGEEPIIVGGQQITNWQHYSGDIYRAHVGNWKFYTLMENGVFSTMARHPNSGWRNMVGAQEGCRDCPREVWFTYASGDIPNFDYSDAQVYVITGGPGRTEWWAMTLPILNINWGARKITVKKWGTWRPLREDDRYRIRGSLDFLDESGEYYLDQSTGYLYYWPRHTPIGSQEIVAPKMRRIIEVKGDSVEGDHAEHIRFEGLTLILTDQSETFQMDDPSVPFRDGLIYLENADNITVNCSTLKNGGFHGIILYKSAQNNVINGNRFEYIAESGVWLEGLAENDIRYVNKNNTVSNNSLYYGYSEHADGTWLWVGAGRTSSAIGLRRSGDNDIVHNEIAHWPYMGIRFSGTRYTVIEKEIVECPACWDYLHTRNNYIGFNDVSYVMEDSNDGGGLHNTGGGKYNVIDNNRFHDIESGSPRSSDATGIYLDNDSSYWTVTNNIVYNIDGGGRAIILKGKYNTLENNILVDNPGTTPRWGGKTHIDSVPEGYHYTIKKNIMYLEDGQRLYYWYSWNDHSMEEIDYNLFYHPESDEYIIQLGRGGAELTLAEWQDEDGGAYDQNSVVADPLFVDRANHNYTLLPGSPAFALGFENIDQDSIGRVGDPCRPDGTPTPSPTSTVTPTLMPTATSTATPTPTATPTTTPTARTVISYYLPLISLVPGIDGDLGEWGALPAVVLDAGTADHVHYWLEVPDSADASAILRSGWDENFLYFAIEVRDDVLVADSADIWRDDGIELGIDGLYDHISSWFDDDHQFTLTFDGRVTDFGRGTEVVTAVTGTLSGGWALEVAIAAEGLGAGPLTVGKAMGFTFGLHDDDDGGNWESYLIWEGHSTNDSSIEYGRLLLTLAPASLGGFAWNDTDADRVQDGVENGISGVTLVLYDIVNDLVESAVTDANGLYRFEELSPGIYTVMATKPPGHRFTTAATVVRSVESGDQDLTVSFGFVATTAVTLVSFEAEVRPEGVVVSWRTFVEQGITGFHLRRALSQFGPWMDVTDGPIPAQGMSGVMATYRVVDDEAERGLTYYYRLVTTPDGQEFGPISVDVGA